MNVGASDVVLDVESRDPLPSVANFQAMSKAAGHRDHAERGTRDFVLDNRHANREVTPTLVFCGIEAGVAAQCCGYSDFKAVTL